jgi:hypothetical protein
VWKTSFSRSLSMGILAAFTARWSQSFSVPAPIWSPAFRSPERIALHTGKAHPELRGEVHWEVHGKGRERKNSASP